MTCKEIGIINAGHGVVSLEVYQYLFLSLVPAGDNVTVTVLGFKGNQIRIGIDAPRDIQIDREEWAAPEEAEILIEYRKAS